MNDKKIKNQKIKLRKEGGEFLMKNTIVILIALAVGALGFFAGMKYQQSKSPFPADFQAMRERMRQGAPGRPRSADPQVVRGEIISQDEESINVKLLDESSKIILISENMEIGKTTEGSIDDLIPGEQVTVFGQTNADGSLSATNIQIVTTLVPW